MSDDWRVTISLGATEHSDRVLSALRGHPIDDELRSRLGDRVVVSDGDQGQVFLYTESAEAARTAATVAVSVVQQHNLPADIAVHRWHPVDEEWENADAPMPSTNAQIAEEHQRLMKSQTEESVRTGVAEWEVRVRLRTHHDAVAMGEKLSNEGESVVRRWRFLVVGAGNEDEAHQLAERIRAAAPAGSSVAVEPGGGLAWQSGMPGTPFTFMSDLGA